MESVGAFEAKPHPSRLFDRVACGEDIGSTRNEQPVARLAPEPVEKAPDVRAVIARVKEIRKGQRLDGVSIRELVEEDGRS